MNRVAVLFAVVAGIAGAALIYLYVGRFEAEVSGGRPIPVLVAAETIPLGTAVTREMLGVREIPEAYLEDRHVPESEVGKVIGVRVSTAVEGGESLLWTDLSTGGTRRNLSATIQAGKRAITIRAEEGTLSRLMRPGDRVDVLFTTQSGAETVTFPLLQNLMVLAVGADTGGGEEQARVGRAFLRNSVTVSVTLAQAQRIAVAKSQGTLAPVLRNPGDVTVLDEFPAATSRQVRGGEEAGAARRAHRTVVDALGREIERVD